MPRARASAAVAWALLWLAASGHALALRYENLPQAPVEARDPNGARPPGPHPSYGMTGAAADAIPVYGDGAGAAGLPGQPGGGAYGAFPQPGVDDNVRLPGETATVGLLRFPNANGRDSLDGRPHFMVPAEVVEAVERAEVEHAARQGSPTPSARDAAAPAPALLEAAAAAEAGTRERERAEGNFLGLSPKTALTIGGVVAGGVALAKMTGLDKKIKESKIGRAVTNFFGGTKAAGAAAGGFSAGAIATAKAAMPFDETKLKDRDPPPAGRTLDPNFDKLDRPELCPGRCSGNGHCLIDKSRLVSKGRVETYPYKCVCGPLWTGVACQTRVDQYIRWFESSGKLAFPECCPVAPSQFKVPTDYDALPVFQNPFSVSNCDPSLSVDSRPDPSGRPPCWRPLSAAGSQGVPAEQLPREQQAGAGAGNAALLETGARADPPPEVVAAANEVEKKRLEERLKVEVPKCCVPCDFDFWSQVNSRPRNVLRPGRGGDFVRALERQRVMEQFGGQAVLRELKRREKMRELDEQQQRRAQDDPFAALLEITPEQQQASDKARAERRNERERERKNRFGVERQVDPQNPGQGRDACVICPVAAADPAGVDMAKYNQARGVDDKENNRFGKFLRRRRVKKTPPCCNVCPSAFWIRTVSKDTDPFFGPQKLLVPVKIPTEEEELAQRPHKTDEAPGAGAPRTTVPAMTST